MTIIIVTTIVMLIIVTIIKITSRMIEIMLIKAKSVILIAVMTRMV